MKHRSLGSGCTSRGGHPSTLDVLTSWAAKAETGGSHVKITRFSLGLIQNFAWLSLLVLFAGCATPSSGKV